MINQLKGFREVYSKISYLFLMFFFALVFYLISVIVTDVAEFRRIFTNYGFNFKILFLYFSGFPLTISRFSFISTIIISLLFGSYVVLAMYKTKQIKKMQDRGSIVGSVGIFLGVIAPGCAACGLGVASFFGLGGLIVSLPFHGLEISVIAFTLLLYANFIVAGKITKNSCDIRIK